MKKYISLVLVAAILGVFTGCEKVNITSMTVPFTYNQFVIEIPPVQSQGTYSFNYSIDNDALEEELIKYGASLENINSAMLKGMSFSILDEFNTFDALVKVTSSMDNGNNKAEIIAMKDPVPADGLKDLQLDVFDGVEIKNYLQERTYNIILDSETSGPVNDTLVLEASITISVDIELPE